MKVVFGASHICDHIWLREMSFNSRMPIVKTRYFWESHWHLSEFLRLSQNWLSYHLYWIHGAPCSQNKVKLSHVPCDLYLTFHPSPCYCLLTLCSPAAGPMECRIQPNVGCGEGEERRRVTKDSSHK